MKLTTKKRESLDQETRIRAIGEFKLEDRCFVIVEEGYGTGSSAADGFNGGTEVGYLEVEGKNCSIVELGTIVETGQDPTAVLTERETEIATLVAMGRPNKQIADRLHISEWTVSTHLRRIFVKLGVRSRAAMVYQCASLIGMAGN
jgi:DNA-binding CsgD family transcriptional regulator